MTTATATVVDAVDASDAVADSDSRLWRRAFWFITIVSALPFLVTRYPPFADVPEHVAAISVLAKIFAGHETPYVLALGQSQYLLVHVIGAGLTLLVGDAVLAHRLLLVAIAIAWSVAFRSLLRALGRDERLSLFAPMAFYSRALLMGFVPFLASVPLGFFVLGATVRLCTTSSPSRSSQSSAKRVATIALLSVALFYTHVSSLALFVPMSIVWVIVWLLRERHVGRLRTAFRTAAIATASFVPSLMCLFLWWRSGSLVRDGSIPHFVVRLSPAKTIAAMPIWTFDLWRSHVDEVCAGIWWMAFFVLLVTRLRRRSGQNKTTTPRTPQPGEILLPLVPFACAVLMYLATPFRVGVASMLNVRLAPVLALSAVVPLAIERRRETRVALAAIVTATLVTSAWSTWEMHCESREVLGGADFDALLARVRRDSRLVSLSFEHRSTRTQYWPYMFGGSYHVARNGGIAAFSFAELRHWPIHYAPGAEPPKKRESFWIFNPCLYRYEEDGAYYDYVLVQGQTDPFEQANTPGPHFVRIATAGAFTLFEKEASDSSSSSTSTSTSSEAGPCSDALPNRRW